MKPASRRLRVYAIDPSLSTALDIAAMNEAVISVPWEELSPGPAGEYIEVIDHDPASGCFYAPVDLNRPELLASDGVAPDAGDPRFHQQMVYAVAMRTIRNFETALGRTALWSPLMTPGVTDDRPLCRATPHLPARASRDQRILQPGQKGATFRVSSGQAHSVRGTDGMHRNLRDRSGDALAFHEAFADVVALMQHFSLPQVLDYAISRTGGDLRVDNLLAQIGQEFGMASGLHKALRSALDRPPGPKAIEETKGAHDRGAILVAAIFDAFVAVYTRRTADLMRLATGGAGLLRSAIHLDRVGRLAGEARQAAQHVLTMCIRALDYCPAVEITLGEYLRAIILKAFPERTDARLREFAAEEYHRRRRHDDAMKLMWAEFSERPFLETYKTLEKHAKKAGDWPEWRERALAEIRVRIAKAKEKLRGQARPRWWQADDHHSVLVEIFLYEGKSEDAWREAGVGGCSDSLWLRLAANREKEHPEDAAPIYLKYAEAGVAATSNGRYEEPVNLLAKAAAVMGCASEK